MADNPTHGFPRTEFPAAGSGEPYAGFGGTVGEIFASSESWWPPRPEAPDGAPNIVVILCDDVGFSDFGCFGSEIDTPNLDRLAAEGLRFTNFHVTPLCSPSRASLLTGQLTGHAAGVGHVAHSDPGFTGYAMELSEDVATMPEILRGHGYRTLMSGKWHLAKDSDQSDAGPHHSWPLGKGFDRYYGFLDGFTNFHQPHRLVRDNHTVEIDTYPEGYYLTDDLTGEAIDMVRASKVNRPDQPFFLYLAHGAVHAPLQAKAETIAKYAEVYTVGWDAIRHARYERCQQVGVVPKGVTLPPRNSEPGYEAPPWKSLSSDEQALFARYMAVYAAMVEHIDESLGALRAALEAMEEWDNTLLFFTSDNGASKEGGTTGTTGYYVHLGGDIGIDRDHARLDRIGGPEVLAHYPQGWAMACNTPYRLYKRMAHQGGRHVPMIMSWPARVHDPGATRTQFAHLSDVLPTVLDVLGAEAPTERDGRPLRPPTGVSMLPAVDDADADIGHDEHIFEVDGHRGFHKDDWEIVTIHEPLARFNDDEWELYDLEADPTETVDLSELHPDKVAELSKLWHQAAWNEQVFPLDSGSGLKFILRPDRVGVYEEPVVVPHGTPTMERWRSQQLIFLRGALITVDLSFESGDRGWLFAHGDQGGGYGLHVDRDELVFVHNDGHGTLRTVSGGIVPDGASEIACELEAPGGGAWRVHLSVDGTERAVEDGFRILFPMAPFEGITVGRDPRSPISWEIGQREGSFPWTGTLRSVAWAPGPLPPDNPRHFIEQMREIALTYE